MAALHVAGYGAHSDDVSLAQLCQTWMSIFLNTELVSVWKGFWQGFCVLRESMLLSILICNIYIIISLHEHQNTKEEFQTFCFKNNIKIFLVVCPSLSTYFSCDNVSGCSASRQISIRRNWFLFFFFFVDIYLKWLHCCQVFLGVCKYSCVNDGCLL